MDACERPIRYPPSASFSSECILRYACLIDVSSTAGRAETRRSPLDRLQNLDVARAKQFLRHATSRSLAEAAEQGRGQCEREPRCKAGR
jgi:hypothetical protein